MYPLVVVGKVDENSVPPMKKLTTTEFLKRKLQPRRPFRPLNTHSIASHVSVKKDEKHQSITDIEDKDCNGSKHNFTAFTQIQNPVIIAPPDSMGCIGPKQYVMMINDYLITFDKETGQPDGHINISTDVLFGYPPGTTTDPTVVYDPLSSRWYISMITNFLNPDGTSVTPNTILLGVSVGPYLTSPSNFNIHRIIAQTGIFFDMPAMGV